MLKMQAQRLLSVMFGVSQQRHCLGRYELVKEIGRGGMGIVYLALDHELARHVAVKTLLVEGVPKYEARLVREARLMAKLAHPNIVRIYDTGVSDGVLFIVMEYIEGVNVAQWLSAKRPRVEEILEVFIAAGEGLSAAHDEGLVHRDFKPANVLIGDDGRICVADFGLAELDPGGACTVALDDDDGDVGVAGTPRYMSPEQFVGRWVDAKSDQFAFCASLYEALYERVPSAVMAGGRMDDESSMVLANARVPRWLRGLLLRGLSHAPEERFESMRALLVVLSRRGTTTRRTSDARLQLKVIFSATYDFEELDEVEIRRLQDLLRIVTKDPDLIIEDVTHGSIILTLLVSVQGALELLQQHARGTLAQRLGLIHISVEPGLRARILEVERAWVQGGAQRERAARGRSSGAPLVDLSAFEKFGDSGQPRGLISPGTDRLRASAQGTCGDRWVRQASKRPESASHVSNAWPQRASLAFAVALAVSAGVGVVLIWLLSHRGSGSERMEDQTTQQVVMPDEELEGTVSPDDARAPDVPSDEIDPMVLVPDPDTTCSEVRAEAQRRYDEGEWGGLEEITRDMTCWKNDSPHDGKELRIEALFELGRAEDCYKLGRTTRNATEKLETFTNVCKIVLEEAQ